MRSRDIHHKNNVYKSQFEGNRLSYQPSLVREKNLFDTASLNMYKDAFGKDLNQSGMKDVRREVFYLDIDSRDRDRAVFADPHEYRINFVGNSGNTSGRIYRNVESIELMSLCVPNTNNVLNEQYILLHIGEFRNRNRNAPTVAVENSMTKIVLKYELGAPFLRIDTAISSPLVLKFPQTDLKSSLSQFSISFRKYDGTLFSFGADNAVGIPVNEAIQNSMTFKITCVVRDTNSIDKRIV